MDKKEKIKAFFISKYAFGGYMLAGWLLLWGVIFLVGHFLESLPLFLLFYNLVYPVLTVLGCYYIAKKSGIVWYMLVTMNVVAILLFAATELMRYAQPNCIVFTMITTFFATGIGNVMHGSDDKKEK